MAIRLSEEQVLNATGATRSRIGARASYQAVCTDTRHLVPGCLFVALKGERFDAHDFLFQAAEGGASGLLVEKGRQLKLPGPDVAVYEVDDSLKALGALAHFHRTRFRKPVGAVTGSNGKTTTKEMIAAILATRGPALHTEGNLNNEIGVPMTLFNLEPRHVAAVIEMGMNHAGELARLAAIAQPDAGMITVIQRAHLEGLGSIEGVAAAKGELFAGLKPGATAVVNVDDPRIAEQALRLAPGVKTLTFGRAAGAQIQLTTVEMHGRDGLAIVITHEGKPWAIALNLIGDHNAMNATGAFAMAIALGFTPNECVRGLEAAQAHARRLQVVAGLNGVTVIDDCYNANPASMGAALDALSGLSVESRAIAVLGDMLELGAGEAAEHSQLGVKASDQTSLLAFFGARMKLAHHQAEKKLHANARHFLELEPLLAWLKAELHAGDVVLVKGSRGMKLERVVEALTGTASAGGKH
ncbi:MAG: UDP-N-acetylmuramoylalanyl-D-glutamyl-2,6-diaminopimelate--D-alanyl-D-alanine ligase [Myxococcaceae bacterium]|nr:UDP-N-acetylmuramoylalanyl-D-glutamyl-2,6-diaminopimelate--D-alanyl-D-alanine ligase [Myxococcaceae bacterium]